MIKVRVKGQCPYCGKPFDYPEEFESPSLEKTMLCYPEEGGCDERFLIDVELRTQVEVYRLVKKESALPAPPASEPTRRFSPRARPGPDRESETGPVNELAEAQMEEWERKRIDDLAEELLRAS